MKKEGVTKYLEQKLR